MKPDTLLIGLSGMPRAGKDTVAALLEQEFPGIHRTNFSHAIAEEYDQINGTNTRHDEEEKVKHRHGFGNLANARRAEDPHYWVKRTLNKPRPLIVGGVRSVEEADAIREEGGILVRIEISDAVLRERMGEHYHKPEHYVAEFHLNGYPHWDYVIHNDGSREDLEATVKTIAKQIKQRVY